jgi:AcrR family transcriptional regulator
VHRGALLTKTWGPVPQALLLTETIDPERAAQAAAPRRGGARNAARSAATREKILRATVDCLYSLGYHQTSTVVVTKIAGVSRGAMLHHFPSKADLMMATMEHIRGQQRISHRDKLTPIKDPRERFAALIDILWAQYSQPIGVARIEIMLASRSDPECGAYFANLDAELDRNHKARIWPLAERLGFKDRKRVDAIVQLYAAAIRGLAIDALHPMMRPDVQSAVALLRETMLAWADAAGAGKTG